MSFNILDNDLIGALATTSVGIATTAGVALALPFNSETYDIGNWHDTVTNNTRLTVPDSVAYARVFGQIYALEAAALTAVLNYRINGAAGPVPNRNQVGATSVVSGANNLLGITYTSPWVPVSTGDYFELFVTTSINATLLSSHTRFAIEGN